MSETSSLLGISNAIVDVLAHVDEDFLKKIGAPRGSMTLIDEDRAHQIYDMMGPATEMSGGSVANSIAGFANLGGSAAYIGRVRADQLGEIFVHDMKSLGVDIRLQPAEDGSPTARCHVLIDQDGQRTMQTYLGACTELSVSDITEETVGKPGVILIEGYVWATSGISRKDRRLPLKRSVSRKQTAAKLPCPCPTPSAWKGIATLFMMLLRKESTSLWRTRMR
jgi:adenosine kinase